MQPSDKTALLRAVDDTLGEVESLCANLECALMNRRWDDLGQAIADSRRATHALQNAMDEAKDVRDAAFDEGIFRRLHHVESIRENQMLRLRHYHDAVGERLALVGRWRAALRSLGSEKRPAARSAFSEVR